MIALIVLLALVVGLFGTVLWAVARTDQNVGPALGNNNPYPDGVGLLGPGEDGPSFLPTPIISEAEQFRRDAHLHLEKQRGRSRKAPARSWMEEPGAMEAAGLVDAPDPISADRAIDATNDAQAPDGGSHTS